MSQLQAALGLKPLLIDANSGREICSVPTEPGSVLSCRMSADGERIHLITQTNRYAPSVLQTFAFDGEYCEAVGLHGIVEEYGLEPFEVNANSMERTFADKVFAICDYYLAEGPIPKYSLSGF